VQKNFLLIDAVRQVKCCGIFHPEKGILEGKREYLKGRRSFAECHLNKNDFRTRERNKNDLTVMSVESAKPPVRIT